MKKKNRLVFGEGKEEKLCFACRIYFLILIFFFKIINSAGGDWMEDGIAKSYRLKQPQMN